MPVTTDRHPLRAGVESHDLDAIAAAFAPDAVLYSPITGRIQFRGRDEIREVYRAVLEVHSEIEYTHELDCGEHRVLVAKSVVGGQPSEDMLLLRLDDDGLIRELRLYVRPLPGLAALTAALAPRVIRARGYPRI